MKEVVEQRVNIIPAPYMSGTRLVSLYFPFTYACASQVVHPVKELRFPPMDIDPHFVMHVKTSLLPGPPYMP
jgi:hypothetical protein